MVPASLFKYGSILMDVTRSPALLSNTPMELAVTPFPSPERTPPLTTTYFIATSTGF
jgi:hypothetical protein